MIRSLHKDILQFIKGKTGIFLFFMLSLIMTSIFTFYTVALYKSSGLEHLAFSNLKDAAVFIYPKKNFDYSNFAEIMSDTAEKIHLDSYAYIFQAEKSEDDFSAGDQSFKFIAYPEAESENISKLKTYLYEGENVSAAELERGEKVCVVCGNLPDHDIVINKKTYTIKGAYDVSDNIAYGVIPFLSVKNDNTIPYAAVIKLKGSDGSNYLKLCADAVEILNRFFPEYSVESAARENTYAYDSEFSNTNKILIFMIFLVLVTLSCIYSYIISVREKKYTIYRIFGATKGDIISICLAEIMIYFLSSVVISCGVYTLLVKIVFVSFQPAFAFISNLEVMLYGTLIMLGFMLIIFGTLIAVKNNKSLKEQLYSSIEV